MNNKVYELKNGEGYIKEYDDEGKLIFEGDYLDGKQSEGKVYDEQGNIKYEMKNINGEGKEYDDLAKLKFEGEYLYRKRNANGKEYYRNGNLR